MKKQTKKNQPSNPTNPPAPFTPMVTEEVDVPCLLLPWSGFTVELAPRKPFDGEVNQFCTRSE